MTYEHERDRLTHINRRRETATPETHAYRELLARVRKHAPERGEPNRFAWPNDLFILTLTLETYMGLTEDLQAAVDKLTGDITIALNDVADESAAATAAIADIQGELANLKAQLPDPNAAAALEVALAGADAAVQNVGSGVASVTAALKAADPGAAAGAPSAPAGAGQAGGPGDPGAAGAPSPTPDPAPAVDAPPPPPPASRPVYTFDGDPSTADAQWTLTGEQAADGSSKLLFTFAGDSPGTPPAGDGIGGQWHLYTGPSEPTPPKAAV